MIIYGEIVCRRAVCLFYFASSRDNGGCAPKLEIWQRACVDGGLMSIHLDTGVYVSPHLAN